MGYNSIRNIPPQKLKDPAIKFLRDTCEDIRYDASVLVEEEASHHLAGYGWRKGLVPYNQSVDEERLLFEYLIGCFLSDPTRRRETAWEIVIAWLKMFFGAEGLRTALETLSEGEVVYGFLEGRVATFIDGLRLYVKDEPLRDGYYRAFKKTGHEKLVHFLRNWGCAALLGVENKAPGVVIDLIGERGLRVPRLVKKRQIKDIKYDMTLLDLYVYAAGLHHYEHQDNYAGFLAQSLEHMIWYIKRILIFWKLMMGRGYFWSEVDIVKTNIPLISEVTPGDRAGIGLEEYTQWLQYKNALGWVGGDIPRGISDRLRMDWRVINVRLAGPQLIQNFKNFHIHYGKSDVDFLATMFKGKTRKLYRMGGINA